MSPNDSKIEYVTTDQALAIAKEAGKAAAGELLTTLGINTGDPAAIIQQQVDFAHLRRSRQTAEKVSIWLKLTIIGIACSGAAAAFWQGFNIMAKKSGAP